MKAACSAMKTFDKNASLKSKGVAILLLFFHHLFYLESRIVNNGVVFRFLSQETVIFWATLSRVCVYIFIFLSAYGMSVQYGKIADKPGAEPRVAYIKKRWFSLMKPYWIVCLFMFALCALLGKDPMSMFESSWGNLVLCFFGVSDFVATKMPVGAWWYMCFAQILLLLLPFLYELCKKYGILTVLLTFVCIPYLGDGIYSKYGGSYINYVFAILLGILMAQSGMMDRLGARHRYKAVGLLEAAGLVVGAVVCLYINYRYSGTDTWKYTKLMSALGAVMIILFAHKYVTWKPLEAVLCFLGKHSGNMFLLHPFTYLYWPKSIYWSSNPVLIYLSVLAISLAGSLICGWIGKLVHKVQTKAAEKIHGIEGK